jgi:CBS domain-containing protein
VATIAEIMSRGLLTVEPGISLQEAARQMDERHVGAALVLEGDALRGIVTERDVLRAVAAGPVEGVFVADWMTHHPETIDASETTRLAASLMIHGGFRHLPVLDGERVVGIVSIRDLMRVTLDDETPRGA